MGKKACLSLDLEYHSWTDEYHEGDEEIDIGYDDEDDGQSSNAIDPNIKSLECGLKCCEIAGTKSTEKVSCANNDTRSPSKRTLTVVRHKPTLKVLYVHNPRRRLLFSDHIASSDDLLVHVISYLDLMNVFNLSMVSKHLREGLAKEGLYCRTENNTKGILLPALLSVADRLLPLDVKMSRPCHIIQSFAHECLAFHEASKGIEKHSFKPAKVLSINMPDRINAISCGRTLWKQPSTVFDEKGLLAPTKIFSWKSGIRISYITDEPNSCALMTVWGSRDGKSSTAQSSVAKSLPKTSHDRYLPPNTKHVIDAAIYPRTNLCAILAQPLEDQSLSHYVLSLVSLPTAPPETAKDNPDKYKLLWQRDISMNLFSSSETHPICSFSAQGNYIIFGSAERFAVVSVDKGSQMFDPLKHTTHKIDAYLFYHEFLFILDNDGKRLRVYDVSNASSTKPIAEGELPWSIMISSKHKKASGCVRLHHSHEKRRHQLKNEYQLSFCAGRLWVTGFFHFDLICTWPRLLRRLRSQLSSSTGSVLALQFTRIKTDLQLSAPKPMYAWNDSHLYVVDSTKLYRWKAPDVKSASMGHLETFLASNDYIEAIHCDGTKVVVATNCTFRNTTSREWDGSGSITVIPIDVHEPPHIQAQPAVSTPTPRDRQSNKPNIDLFNPRAYSPLLQLHNKRFFRHHTFVGRINAPNVHGSNLQSLRQPISSSTESNYMILDMFSEDGRYLAVRCKKGNSNKIVVFDLYSCEKC